MLDFEQRAHPRRQSLVGPGAGAFEFDDAFVHLVEGFAHGAHHRVDGFLALVEVALGYLLEAAQGGLREVEEALVVAAQGLGTQRLEGIGEFVPRVLQQEELAGVGVALGGQRGVEFGGAGLEVAVFKAQVEKGIFQFGQAGALALGGGAAGGFVAQGGGMGGVGFQFRARGEEGAFLAVEQPGEECRAAENQGSEHEAGQEVGRGEVQGVHTRGAEPSVGRMPDGDAGSKEDSAPRSGRAWRFFFCLPQR